MILDTFLSYLLLFLMIFLLFLVLNLSIFFCQVMAVREEQKARQRRKSIFNEKKGDG